MICPYCAKRRRTLNAILRHIRRCSVGRAMYADSVFAERP